MSQHLWILVAVAALWLLPRVLRAALVLRVLLKTGMAGMQLRRVSPADLTAHERETLDAAARRLVPLGFRPLAWVEETERRPDPLGARKLVLADESGTVLAEASVRLVPEDGKAAFRLGFQSELSDGTALVTINEHATPAFFPTPRTLREDVRVPDATALEHHRRRLAACGRFATAPDADAYLAAEQARQDDFDRALAASRDVVRRADGLYRLRLRAALKGLPAQLRALNRQAAQAKQRAAVVEPPPTPEAEVQGYFTTQKVLGRMKSGDWKLPLLLVSLALFLLSFLPSHGLRSLGMLLAVLVFHELGHLAAMRAFGYRDLGLFFLPFLGAAATGRNAEASASQRVLVALAGPVPGLLLGIAVKLHGGLLLSLGASPDLVLELGWMLLGVNVFNLLPVLPLDGGHVLNELLFRRNPWVETIFHVGAGLALVAFGLLLDFKLLAMVGALLVFGTVATWRRSRLSHHLAALRRQGRLGGEEELVRAAFAWLRAHAPALPFQQKVALVRGVAQLGVVAPARFGTTVLLLFVWLVTLAAMPVAAVLNPGGGLAGLAARELPHDSWNHVALTDEKLDRYLWYRRRLALPRVGDATSERLVAAALDERYSGEPESADEQQREERRAHRAKEGEQLRDAVRAERERVSARLSEAETALLAALLPELARVADPADAGRIRQLQRVDRAEVETRTRVALLERHRLGAEYAPGWVAGPAFVLRLEHQLRLSAVRKAGDRGGELRQLWFHYGRANVELVRARLDELAEAAAATAPSEPAGSGEDEAELAGDPEADD